MSNSPRITENEIPSTYLFVENAQIKNPTAMKAVPPMTVRRAPHLRRILRPPNKPAPMFNMTYCQYHGPRNGIAATYT